MNLLHKIDRVVDSLASAVSDSSNRKPVKVGIYLVLITIALWLPYSIVRHIYASGFYLVSVERETRVGEKTAREMETRMIVSSQDGPVSVYVSEIGGRIAREHNPWDANFRFRVIEDEKMANAFALPGGKIYITTGLLRRMDNESELAAVLAHEVAHVSKRHYARNMGRQMLMSWVKKFLGGTDRAILDAGSFFATNLALITMRQENEIEADYYGTLYIYELDYDPEGAVSLAKKLLHLEQEMPDIVKVLALTHPPSRERVEALMDLKDTLAEKEGLVVGVERYSETVKSNF